MIDLIRNISDKEDEKTNVLFSELPHILSRGYYTRQELIRVLRWKSSRPINHYEKNTESTVQEATKLAIQTENEGLKIHILTALIGVNYPSASALLMFVDRTLYPVLDIRVWQQLHSANLVLENARGQNFSLSNWLNYLAVIRRLGKELSIDVRQVEKRIFNLDKMVRKTKLYDYNRLDNIPLAAVSK